MQAAKKALPAWRALSTQERAEYLLHLSRKIEENLNDLALMETRDTGKPIHTSKNIDIPRSAKNLQFFADFAREQQNEEFHGEGLSNFVNRSPIGVVGCISPGTFPFIYSHGK